MLKLNKIREWGVGNGEWEWEISDSGVSNRCSSENFITCLENREWESGSGGQGRAIFMLDTHGRSQSVPEVIAPTTRE
ncbi:hypothetical protein WA1_23000 [Scytonema hofmannii PCC 7110]|uniref:Uncharacterized protein n=1 Tax=Scytonema hofmannii PCC 7110 TaxID=128403 RepID=A0A139X8I9_9CYAN|nr:hypothetical protein [Scytonema hofmannii]KYC41000.1 hypothetical protein WA1_23000 [Scytonema hofmannii PCC 7110]